MTSCFLKFPKKGKTQRIFEGPAYWDFPNLVVCKFYVEALFCTLCAFLHSFAELRLSSFGKPQSRLRPRAWQLPYLCASIAANRGIGPKWPNRKLCWAVCTGGGELKGGYRNSSCQVAGNRATVANCRHSIANRGLMSI